MSYTPLTPQERMGLFYQRGMGQSFREIAAYFGRSHSTMVREYKRNKNPHDQRYYHEIAQIFSERRSKKPTHQRKWNDEKLRA